MNFKKRMKLNFYPVLKDYIGKQFVYLEIGIFRGTNIKWVLENIATHPECKLYGIDPWDKKYFNKHDLKNEDDWFSLLNTIAEIEDSSNGRIKFINGYSHIYLKENPFPKESFDAVYIDGDHTIVSVLRDYLLSWPLLKIGGVMIFDDYLMRDNDNVKQVVDAILFMSKKKYELLFKNRQVGIRKTK